MLSIYITKTIYIVAKLKHLVRACQYVKSLSACRTWQERVTTSVPTHTRFHNKGFNGTETASLPDSDRIPSRVLVPKIGTNPPVSTLKTDSIC